MTILANQSHGATLVTSTPPASLRERALFAAETERTRTRAQERERRAAELENQREDLARVIRQILGETVALEAIALPEDAVAPPWRLLTVEVDALTFCVSAHPADDPAQGTSRLKVSLLCPQCKEVNWYTVRSLSGLGLLLRQLEDGSISESCSTCLMAAEWEDDPFRDE